MPRSVLGSLGLRSSLFAIAIVSSAVACSGASDEVSGPPQEVELGETTQSLLPSQSMPAAGSEVVGATPGNLTVTRLGQASYTMPITVAPGPGGMSPALSLEYTSGDTDGVFGVGFSLSGLSAIARCPKTVTQDGAPDSLRWDYADRFCLDGQRLVAVSGAYGGDGTEYRTEVESFSRIISRGAANGGPTHFEVWTRDGRYLQYGVTESSRIERWRGTLPAETPMPVHRWLVNRVTDRVGSGYDVDYFENNGANVAVPTAIHSFGANGVRTGQTVELVYQSRPDTKTVFQAGNFFRPYMRMTQLVTKDAGLIVRAYRFAYDNGAAGARTRLVSVTECGGGGVCYAPTRFSWSTPELRYERRWYGTGGQGALLTGDFDADGKTDLLTWWGDRRVWTNHSKGDRFEGWREVLQDLSGERMPLVADFDGDGKSDLLTVQAQGQIWVWRSYGTGFHPSAMWGTRGDIFGSLHAIDINGDGKADLVDREPGKINVRYSTGASFGYLGWVPVSGDVAFGDFDADGRSDLMEVRNHQVYVRRSNGGGFEPEVWWGTLLAGTRQFTDVNGDGTVDVVVRDTNGSAHVYWSTGEKLVYTKVYANGTAASDVFVDLNGDGKADLLGFGEGAVRVGLATTHSIGFDHVPTLQHHFGTHQGTTKSFRIETKRITPTGAWLNGGGDFHWESSTCQDLGYEPANAGFECGHRYGNVDAVHAREEQICTAGEPGDFCNPFCTNDNAVFRSDGWGGSALWTVSTDYTPSQVNCQQVEDSCTDSEGYSWPCGTYSTVCDTQWCDSNGSCTMSPQSPGAWLEGSQHRINGAWSGVTNGQIHDGRCDLAVSAGSDCAGNQYQAYVGMVRAVHCHAPAKPVPADVNGDGLLDIIEVDASGNFWVDVAIGRSSDVVVKINDGIGQEHEIDYATIVDGDPIYSRAYEWTRSVVGRDVEVVKQVRSGDGVSGKRAVSYAYAGGSFDPHGRGFLGFVTVTSTDHSTGHVNVKAFYGAFPHVGQEAWEKTLVGAVAVRETIHTVDVSGGGAPWVVTRTQTDETTRELDGSPVRFVRTTYGGHAFGFPGTVTVDMRRAPGDAAEVVSSTTTNTYTHDTSSWILGRLTRSTVSKSRTGAATETRTSSFTYQPANGLLESETVEPDDVALRMTTTHAYDLFGNRASSTETAGSLTRTRSWRYDGTGRFVVEETNAMGHVSTFVNDGRFGVVTQATDPNGLVTTYVYDPMGRKIGERLPDGRVTAIYFERPAAGDPAGAAIVTRSLTTESGTTRVVTDTLGRTIRKTTDGFGGRVVHVDTVYGPSGLKLRESRPYFAGEARYDHVFAYDALGRETSATAPDGKVVQFLHQGRTVKEVDPRGFVKTKTETVDEKLASVSEVAGGRTLTLSHTYDAHGQLVSSTDPKGVRTTIGYDRRGRRTSIEDPNTGRRTFTVDGLGRVTETLDAKKQRTTVAFDALDRTTRRIERDAAGVVVRDTAFTFDTALAGTKPIRGALAQAETKERRAGTLTVTTRRTLGYDVLAREISETKLIEGTTLRWSRTYEAGTGRVASIRYPGILSASGLAVFPEYDASGRMVAVRRDSATGSTLWRASAADASGAITVETLENGLVTTRAFDPTNGQLRSIKTPRKDGLACVPAACTPNMATWNAVTQRDASGCFYNADSARNERLPAGCAGETPQDMEFVFDAMGNLTQRKDNVTGLNETFQYDELDRLTRVSGPTPKVLAYDDAGNIVAKSDFGDYTYDAARGHLVTSVKKGATTVATYAHDANGNMTAGAGRTFVWNTFDKPARIEAGATYVDFLYDDENQLAQQRSSGGGLTFFGEDFELQVKADGSRERRTFVKVGGMVRAVHRATVAAGATVETQVGTTHLLHDHLGSTSVVTDAAGNVAQRLSYDAHGKRRFALGTDDPAGLLKGKVTDKGFTGHQMLEDLGLVFMGARVYDPMLGRFVSADLIVQSTQDVNGINRYVYGGNNPISTIDPSGHFFKKLWRAIRTVFKIFVAAVITIVVAWVAPVLLPAIANTIWQPIVVAAVSGAINGAISGGARGALMGALTGAITGGIGVAGAGFEDSFAKMAFKSVAHGLVSGARAALSGGTFIHGFISGFAHGVGEPIIDMGDTVFERVAVSAAIGGAASKLSGGSFENGALSGAFAQLFNGEGPLSRPAPFMPNDPQSPEHAALRREYFNRLYGSDRPTPVNQLNQQVQRNPGLGFDRFDSGRNGGQDHFHLRGSGAGLNRDGSVHDGHRGTPNLTNAQREFLDRNRFFQSRGGGGGGGGGAAPIDDLLGPRYKGIGRRAPNG